MERLEGNGWVVEIGVLRGAHGALARWGLVIYGPGANESGLKRKAAALITVAAWRIPAAPR